MTTRDKKRKEQNELTLVIGAMTLFGAIIGYLVCQRRVVIVPMSAEPKN